MINEFQKPYSKSVTQQRWDEIFGEEMPYKSKEQQAYFNANKAKLEKQGVDVDEWNRASAGKKLPAKKKPSK